MPEVLCVFTLDGPEIHGPQPVWSLQITFQFSSFKWVLARPVRIIPPLAYSAQLFAKQPGLTDKSQVFQRSRILTFLPPELGDITTWLGFYSVLAYFLLLQLTPNPARGEKNLIGLHVLVPGDHWGKSRTWRQELKQIQWRNTAYWLVFQGLRSLLM